MSPGPTAAKGSLTLQEATVLLAMEPSNVLRMPIKTAHFLASCMKKNVVANPVEEASGFC